MGVKTVTPSDEDIRAAIASQASEWFIANQAGSLTEADSAAFLAWLKSSPLHVREYLGVARIAHHLPAVVGKPQVPLEAFLAQAQHDDDNLAPLRTLARGGSPPNTRRRVPWALPVAASLLMLAAGLLWWARDGQLFGIPKTYRTAHGEQSLERLPDGSMLRLDTDSEATVRYSAKERLVEINRGQVLLEVAHEAGRRFRITTDGVGVVAVGTRFDVYRKKRGIVEITVAQGEIAVFTGHPSWLDARGDPPSEVRRVKAGYQVRIDGSPGSAQPVLVNLNEVLGWVQHKIVFERRPLGEVAAEFNRYGNVPVEIEDEELRTLPVSGLFDASDTESFVAFLKTLPSVRVDRAPGRIHVEKVRPTT